MRIHVCVQRSQCSPPSQPRLLSHHLSGGPIWNRNSSPFPQTFMRTLVVSRIYDSSSRRTSFTSWPVFATPAPTSRSPQTAQLVPVLPAQHPPPDWAAVALDQTLLCPDTPTAKCTVPHRGRPLDCRVVVSVPCTVRAGHALVDTAAPNGSRSRQNSVQHSPSQTHIPHNLPCKLHLQDWTCHSLPSQRRCQTVFHFLGR